MTETGWVKDDQEDAITLSRMVESANPQTLNYKMVMHDIGRTAYVLGESRRPNPGFIFMIVEMNLNQKKDSKNWDDEREKKFTPNIN